MLRLELRHTLRALLRRPAFTVFSVLTLALGIGATTAIFSAVYHLLLAPLPFAAGDRIGYLWNVTESGFQVVPSVQEASAFMDGARTLEVIEPYGTETMAWRNDAGTEAVDVGQITSTLPAALGVAPVLGRMFADGEAESGALVVLVSESFWRTRLGGDASVLGSTVRLDGKQWEIVGVVPRDFPRFLEHGRTRDFWTPLSRNLTDRANLLAIRREGVTAEQVGEELSAISARIPESRLGSEQPRTRMRTPGESVGDSTRQALVVLFAAVAVVMLIACANVAGLLLIRGSDRQRELAIRAALGADRRALLRHLLGETAILALAAGAVGLLVGAWGIDLVRSIRPAFLEELEGITLDPVVLAFAVGVTVLTALIFGLLPSLYASRSDLRTRFMATSGGTVRSPQGSRAGAALVVVEVALAVMLLVGASLLVRTMLELRRQPLGFDAAGVVTFSVSLPQERYPDPASWVGFADRLNEELDAVPGVAVASLSTGVPPELGILFAQLRIEGSDAAVGDGLMPGAQIDADYFRTLGITLVEGRAFDGTAADERSVIVNRATAQRLWPGESAIGKRMRLGSSETAPWLTVVGVTPDIAVSGPHTSYERPQIFTPLTHDYPFITAAVRMRAGDPLGLVPLLRSAVARLDADLPVQSTTTIERMLAESIGRERFNMVLFGSFAALALVLATVGLYGVVAYNVSRRTREIGIRTALGATPHGVRRMVLRHGAVLAGAGATLGGLGAFQLSRLMEQLLSDVPPRDPVSFAAAVTLVIAVSVSATWVPARRASRVDPLVALRSD